MDRKPHGVDGQVNGYTVSTVREATRACLDYYPHAGGDDTPSVIIRATFRLIRAHVAQGRTVAEAASRVMLDAYRYADM